MSEDIKQKRADRVNKAIALSGDKQYVVAEKAKITPQHLTNVKNAKRLLREEIAKPLADALNVRFEWLMGYDDFMTSEEQEKYYAERFDAQNKALQIILDNAISEVCLREEIEHKTIENLPDTLFIQAQIKDYAVSLVWQYLVHREHSSTWGILDQREE